MNWLRKVWAIYAIVLFLLMVLISIPYLLINMAVTPGPKALRKNIWYMYHPFSNVFFALIGIRLQVHGKELLDRNQSYIIVANHSTSLDFIVSAVTFPGIFRFLAKEELMKIPIFGFVVRKLCLTVDRKSAMSRARSVIAMKQQVAEGWSVLIYPEGSRNTTDQRLAPFYDGAFRIAKQVGAPVVVQTLANVNDISRSAQSLDLAPGVIHVYFDEPISADIVAQEDIELLKERVRTTMLSHLT